MDDILCRITNLEEKVANLIEHKKAVIYEKNLLKSKIKELESKMFWLVR